MQKNLFIIPLCFLLTIISIANPNPALAQEPTPDCVIEYTVQAGDWLSKISQKYLGDPLAYQNIVLVANQADNDTYTNINNVDVIEPGMLLCIPHLEELLVYGDTAPYGAGAIGDTDGELRNVTTRIEEGMYQLTFEFSGSGMPAFDVRYVNEPILDADGVTVPVAGEAQLRIMFLPGKLSSDYTGPLRIPADGHANVREVVFIRDTDDLMLWYVGMDKYSGFLVTPLANPSRLVINILELDPIIADKPALWVGDTGPAVLELQQALQRVGYLTAVPEGEIYDEQTRQAVASFELSSGLVPDGIAGPEVWGRLINEQSPQDAPPPLPLPKSSGYRTHTDAGEPIVYLTFDDGPHGLYTAQITELLDKYDAHATFFVLGQNVPRAVEALRNATAQGHYIANHTFDHANITTLSQNQFFGELDNTRQAILDTVGDLFALDKDVRYMRPPYGAISADARQLATDRNYAVVLWDIDTLDWKRPGAEVIAKQIVDNVYPGVVILMHDGGGDRTQTVAALEMVLTQLSAQGYKFYNVFEGDN